jgi:hypothetical protein
MKKYLLLVLVALGLVAFSPREAKADVDFGISIGVPAYYDPYPYGYYYRPYRYYGYRPYYYRRGYYRGGYYRPYRRYWRHRQYRRWRDDDDD